MNKTEFVDALTDIGYDEFEAIYIFNKYSNENKIDRLYEYIRNKQENNSIFEDRFSCISLSDR